MTLYSARVTDATHSIPILLDPQAPKPLPQLPCPARTPTKTLLPICVPLPITCWPRLALNTNRSPLGGGCGHFDGVVAFGCLSGVEFVLLEGLFEGVGGLAFAFKVFRVVLLVGLSAFMEKNLMQMRGTYHARPPLVSTAFGRVFDHHVRAFFVIVNVAISVLHSRWHHSDSV